MCKKVGLLTFVLAAGALLQPATAAAQDRFEHGNDRYVGELRDQPRYGHDDRRAGYGPERREEWRRDSDFRRDRFVRDERFRDERFYDRDFRFDFRYGGDCR